MKKDVEKLSLTCPNCHLRVTCNRSTKKLLALFEELRAVKLSTNRTTLQTRERKARDQLLSIAASEEERQRLSQFNASDHWVNIFVTRIDLESVVTPR